MKNEKFKFSIKNKLDLAIVISGGILLLTGAFLRFFKYLFSPTLLEKITLILIPESIILAILLSIKLWRN